MKTHSTPSRGSMVKRGAHRAFGGELFVLRLLFRAGRRRRDLAELHRLGQFAARVHRVLLVNERDSPTV